MTALKDAMKKAGLDTARAELLAKAAEVLRAHGGDTVRATPKFSGLMRKRGDLLDALVLDFLRRVAADMPANVSVRAHGVRAHKRRQPRPRTSEEKAAALRAADRENLALRSVFDDRKIDGRPIGDLRWGELLSLVHANALKAARYLQLGTEETENAIILDKIEAHVTVLDHSTKVRDAISAERLEQIIDEAHAEAPRVIEYGMARYARTIETRRLGERAQ